MKTFIYACATVTLVGFLWEAGSPGVRAQEKEKPAAGAARDDAWPKRLKDGQPDVQGIWDPLGSLGCFGGLGPGCIVDPPDRQIPYLPWAAARKKEAAAGTLKPNRAQMDTRTRAWPDGVPRQNYYHELQILQPPGAVVILYDAQHEFRYIPLDSRRPLDDGIALWMGSSRGRWEGTTLVVEVRNLSDRMRLSLSGDFASDDLTVTERWEFVDKDTLQLSATLTDPKVYSQPWTVRSKLTRHEDPTFELMEYAGVEGERDADLMMEIIHGEKPAQ
ncbi:MAG: hypothetical protein FJW23_07965 [Acidimicrobiia bacterium]|nr:hypothetical protein [Acidimicrobiia bacterium]